MSDLDTTKNELNGDEIKMEIQIPSKEEQTENSEVTSNKVEPVEKMEATSQSTAENEQPTEPNENPILASQGPVESSGIRENVLEGWETPPQESVNGIIQPRVIPPIGKPTRWTNQLDFLMKDVLKQAKNHKHAWPFQKPVDSIKLNIPDYHKVIKRPMDLGTIEKRLRNMYYYSSKECLKDIMTIFNNCYVYNPPEYGVYKMAKELEHFILMKLSKIPPNEVEIPFPNQKKSGGNKATNKRIVRATSTTTTKASRESSAQRGVPDSSSSINVIKLESDSTEDHSQKGKGVKRKADTTTSFDEDQGPSTKQTSAPVQPVKRENRPPKKAPPPVDYSLLKPRFKGKLNEQMKFCTKLINELLSKKCKGFNWPFIEAVDANAYPDYYEIIKNPMDLDKVKRKLDARQYADPEEFRSDVKLICANCFIFNPEGQPVNQLGKQLQEYFNNRWKNLPPKLEPAVESPPVPAVSVAPLPPPKEEKKEITTTSAKSSKTISPSNNTATPPSEKPIDDDEQIDMLLFNVTDKIMKLQQFSQEIILLKSKRSEARKHQNAIPFMPAELHSSIKNTLNSATFSPLTQFASAFQIPPTAGFLPSVSNLMNNPLLQPILPANLPPMLFPTQPQPDIGTPQKKRGGGRPKKSGNKINTAPAAAPPASIVNSNTGEPILPPNISTSAPQIPIQMPPMVQKQLSVDVQQQQQAALAIPPPQQQQPPPPKIAPIGGKRGRPSGSKNKPKAEQPIKEQQPIPPPAAQRVRKREYEFHSDDEHSFEPMTYDEKFQLSQDINSLTADKVPTIMEIIAAHEKIPDVSPEEKELEIDFETFKTITLRELEAFVKNCQQQEKKGKDTLVPKTSMDLTKKKQVESTSQMNGLPSSITNGGVQVSLSKSQPDATMKSLTVNRTVAKDTLKDISSSESSSSGSSSSESSSSESSDSESEEKQNPRKPTGPSAPQSVVDNKVFPSSQVRSAAQTPQMTPLSAIKTPQSHQSQGSAPKEVTTISKPATPMAAAAVSSSSAAVAAVHPPTSHVHSGAAPLLQSNNPTEINAGISASVLDLLLPNSNDEKGGGPNAGNIMNKNSWSSLAQKATGVSQLGSNMTTDAFEKFRKQAREKEERKKQLKEEEEKRRKQREIEQKQQSGTNISDSTQPKKPQINQEEINRLREMEKERRKREEMDHVDMASQMELMANFESRF